MLSIEKLSYSLVIKILKYFFLVISVGIVFLTFYNKGSLNLMPKIVNEGVIDEFLGSSQVLLGPTFIGLDKKKQPYKISASKASKVEDSSEIFNLENPKGEIVNDEETYQLQGNEGLFDKPKQFLKLKGNVVFSDKEMFSFKTSEATMYFKKKLVLGKKKVTGKKQNSTILSEGFEIEQKKNKITFKGKSKLVLRK